jgi:hypothetical protein
MEQIRFIRRKDFNYQPKLLPQHKLKDYSRERNEILKECGLK